MTTQSDTVARALAAQSSSDVLDALLPGRPALTLSDIQRLTKHLEKLPGARTPLRIGILHTYTSDLLAPYLRFESLLQGFQAEIYHGLYGAVVQEAEAASGLVAHEPDITLLLLQWGDLEPGIGESSSVMPSARDERDALLHRAQAQLMQQVGMVRRAVGGHLLVTLLPSVLEPGLGDFDATASASEQAWRGRAKTEFAAALRDVAATTFLDLDEGVATIGRERYFDLRWWYSARFPFAPAAAQDLARRVVAAGVVLKRPRAKVIAVDADNTLWGGIIGEDGMHGIALGPDYPGNAYVAFQRRLLQYQQRGFVLALCSKNNEADVLEVLRDHPHQVLRERHFAAIAVNWEPKPGNLQRIAEELGLGLESFIFVDDSLHECGAVRAALPIVDVVPAPANPIELPTCLDRIGRLEILTLTKEDQQKTQMYVEQRQRAQLEAASTDLESYLQSLHMEMHVTLNDSRHVARIAQLTQKTNQFNLTTRRYTEDAIARLIEADDSIVATFSLRDIFGDSGLVGIALLRVESTTAVLDSFLLSCRVIGRRAESAFFNTLLRVLRARGVDRVRGEFIPTAKNKLAESFLTDHAFAASDGAYERDLRIAPPLGDDAYPIRVEITGARDGELMELVRQS